ncbi:serine hydrolase domain-containing protein [Streptococcus ratti]|uniref:Secreted esterase n=1 Tax=Streptococcus ratti FA-1 = DSM 20564 TaxID=699248 RepID=A0ABN0GV94_STRRT|nr:serine hydrolase domain-containing protein [Streptococcus ratti]EJN94411.1 putative secreted esterase [Streptococcus ratti FA-1 = DSM 20564]EMP70025.1 secreted esterase [Streptococcus ratti FA-1 = DSM 20564]QEY06353.1 beta-lactamase family protein [Streptococcus ratti]VEI60697.1 secreted esterase [Streptococcus mutans]
MSHQKIITKIQDQISQHIYLGASLALYENDSWQEFYLGETSPLERTRPNLFYDLASVSKVIGVGTVCIFMLNSGLLELDQSLQFYYPAFHDKSVTLRQLLTHTSGIDPYIPNRNSLSAAELRNAVNHIKVTADKSFKYTDINFILLGFMLENLTGQSLDILFEQEIFKPWNMSKTTFGPVSSAVPTVRGIPSGRVHDPKAQVLGVHTGSAGLFSTLKDLEIFANHCLTDDFARRLTKNYSLSAKERSLAWDLEGDWLLHTGYTGTFVLINIPKQRAAIFLSNRTYEKDERAQWILDRNELIALIEQELTA